MILGDKFVFIHVPKTGGQSIHAAIGARVNLPMNSPRFAVNVGKRFSFCFVRNPWERMVSYYRFLCQRAPMPFAVHDPAALRDMGFNEWLLNAPFWSMEDAAWGGKKLPPVQQRPQLWWATGCDFIGRFEHLEEDFADACWRADIRSPSKLPRLNATIGDDWRAEYNLASRAFVAQYFAPDTEQFGYSFNA